MSTDTFLLGDLLTSLEERLTTALTGWNVRNMTEGLKTSLNGLTLYYEQGDLSSETKGQPMPPGFVGVDFSFTVASHTKDPVKGLTAVNAGAMALCPVLDGMRDVYWSSGQRGVLTSGEPCYLFPVTVLARYQVPSPPDPEPQPEPEPTPEPEPNPAPEPDAEEATE